MCRVPVNIICSNDSSGRSIPHSKLFKYFLSGSIYEKLNVSSNIRKLIFPNVTATLLECVVVSQHSPITPSNVGLFNYMLCIVVVSFFNVVRMLIFQFVNQIYPLGNNKETL